jgi:hypothetical protein
LRGFEDRVLRRIFGPKRDKLTGSWRKLHNEELQNLYSSPNVINIIKSKKMRWVRREERMGKREMSTKFFSEHLKKRDRLEDIRVGWRIILKWTLGNKVGGCGLHPCGL